LSLIYNVQTVQSQKEGEQVKAIFAMILSIPFIVMSAVTFGMVFKIAMPWYLSICLGSICYMLTYTMISIWEGE